VEVDLQDPLFRPEQLDQRREPGFQAFAQPTAAGPEEQVLGHLLGQGAGTANAATALVVRQGGLDGWNIAAPVAGELLILASNDRHLELVRYPFPGLPGALQVDGLAVEP